MAMAPNVTGDDLDGLDRQRVYPDDTVIRAFIRRSSDYESGWSYKLHYGSTVPSEETLSDGTIRRHDNSHEDSKGHELHVAPDPDPIIIDPFPGMVEIWRQFWDAIPKDEFEVP